MSQSGRDGSARGDADDGCCGCCPPWLRSACGFCPGCKKPATRGANLGTISGSGMYNVNRTTTSSDANMDNPIRGGAGGFDPHDQL